MPDVIAEVAVNDVGDGAIYTGEEFDRDEVEARAAIMLRELENLGTVTVAAGSAMDRFILVDCISGSTWCAVHAGESDQKRSAVYLALRRASAKIAAAFGVAEDWDIPAE